MGAIDLKSKVGFAVLHAKAAVTATQTIVGTTVSGFHGATFVVDVGTHTADDLVVTYQEQDGSAGWTNIAEGDLDGTGTSQSRSLVAADDSTQIFVGYKGNKEQIGVVITDSGTGSVVVGAYVMKGFPKDLPSNAN
jgi:hypothetical protein